jgi:uncharacterized protein (DUF1330 family)
MPSQPKEAPVAVFLVVQVDVLDEQKYGQYGSSAPPLERWGGQVLAYDLAPAVIEGSVKRQRMGVVRFPSREQFQGWYDSPEYQAARKHRVNGGAEADLVLIEGLPGAG